MTLTETHVSFIFIADAFVYKVKKAVDFGFLNFTTLDRRRFYCEEEVRLNRRLCPDIYLGVVELREGPSGPVFGGPGGLIDYAVKMKRLPEERMLNRLLAQGELGPEQLAEIARVVARFHAAAARGPQIDLMGDPAAIRANWEENFRQVAPFVGKTLSAADLALMRRWVERYFAEKGEALRQRVADGFIRECDGDLHLGNICLTSQPERRPGPGTEPGPESGVCIFDCIEFNEKFRFTDTAADVAFLLMDLEYSGRADLCPAFLEAYQEQTGDLGMSELLDLYKANRALIRGKVRSLRMVESGISAEEAEVARSEAVRYFRLARGYCLRERLSPSLVITCGLTGSGKSAFSRQFCRELGLRHLASDLLRKELGGKGKSPLPPLRKGGDAGATFPSSAGTSQGAPSSSSKGVPQGATSPSSGQTPPGAPSPSRGGTGWGWGSPPDSYDSGLYSSDMNRATYQALKERAAAELAAGRSVLADATFRRAADREEFRALAREAGAPFFVLHTVCPVEIIRQRLEKRREDPDEVSDGRWEIFPQQAAEFEPLGPDEAIEVDTSGTLEQAVDQALEAMGILP